MAVWESALAQVSQLWTNLTVAQRAVLALVAAGLAIGFAGVLLWAGSPEYDVLYTRLAADDAGEVIQRLKDDNIPYRLGDSGRTVLVPTDRVYDLRISLAGEGIPQGGVVGFEIFDQSGFGMTDFAQKVNYTRALEGELTRTIRRIEGVEGARVHLVLPERRLFEEEQRSASASVVLQLGGGRRLSTKQVEGIVFLVASSVDGLQPDTVTVVDTGGNVLYQTSGEETGMLAASQLEFKRAYEKDVEQRVRQMLERVVGQGAAVVQAAAQFDFDRVQETSETYDPQNVAVRSEERVTESSAGAGGPSGVPGVTSNLGQGAAGQTAAGASSNRESETVNYEVSKTVTRVERQPGSLRRLSVAVVVDGTYRNAEDANAPKEFVPRSSQELAQIRALVEKAVGFDGTRGDAVEVTSIPFRPAEEIELASSVWGPELWLPLAKYGVAAFLTLAILMLGVRPMLRWLGSAGRSPELSQPMSVSEMERALEGGGAGPGAEAELDSAPPSDTVRRETLKKRLRDMVAEEPQTAAQLLRSWMSEE